MHATGEVSLKVQNAVLATANAHGLNVTSEQVEAVTEQAAKLLSDFVLGVLNKEVDKKKEDAVKDITTLEQAEESAKRKR